MKEINAGGKTLFIVDSHHEVLQAWNLAREKSNVFSLDYHTDTKTAFQSYSYWRADSELKSGKCSDSILRAKELTDQKIRQYLKDQIPLKKILYNLKHDEHLDFAVRTKLIENVFLLAKNSNRSSSNENVYIHGSEDKYRNQKIIEYSPPCVNQCKKEIHDENCRNLRADFSIEDSFLEDALTMVLPYKPSFFDRYILDIDCDYFNTEKSLYPSNAEVFKRLVKNSEFITIALEPACVKICRHQGNVLTSEIILDRLVEIISSL